MLVNRELVEVQEQLAETTQQWEKAATKLADIDAEGA
jgi:hypothetical protein